MKNSNYLDLTMSYQFYKVLHFVGLLLTVYGLFGLSSVLWAQAVPNQQMKRIWAISHGVGLLLLVVAGFGLAARLGFAAQMPKWVWAKVFIWFLLGAILSPIKRKPQHSGMWLVVVFILVIAAILLAVNKPF